MRFDAEVRQIRDDVLAAVWARNASTIELDDAARVAATGYTEAQIHAARERLAEIRALDAAELRGGTQ